MESIDLYLLACDPRIWSTSFAETLLLLSATLSTALQPVNVCMKPPATGCGDVVDLWSLWWLPEPIKPAFTFRALTSDDQFGTTLSGKPSGAKSRLPPGAGLIWMTSQRQIMTV